MIKLKTAKEHFNTWNSKPILKYIYKKWYKRILSNLNNKTNGPILEIGSGCGNIKEFIPNAISSDIQQMPWLEVIYNAEYIPFQDESISTIVMIDVLHHLNNPKLFLKEAYRILNKNGLLIILEPYPTLISNIFYKYFHHEPMNKSQSIISENANFNSPNQAAFYILFNKEFDLFKKKYSDLYSINKIELFSFILYPLSGGYKKFNLVPKFLISFFNKIEYLILPFRKFLAFRSLIVLGKQNQ